MTAAPGAGQPRVNVALASAGATASASSSHDSPPWVFPPSGAIDGEHKGANWSTGGGWNDATPNSYPDWLQVDFAGTKTIDEIGVYTVQDADTSPAEPTEAMTFSLYGLTAYEVQYWTGSEWAAVPGGGLTGNDRVWRKVRFPAVVTTKVRVLIHSALASYSRVVEVEAWGPVGAAAGTTAADVRWVVTDHLGTPRMVLDRAGSLAGVVRHDYLPFGEELMAGTGGRMQTQGTARPITSGSGRFFLGSGPAASYNQNSVFCADV